MQTTPAAPHHAGCGGLLFIALLFFALAAFQAGNAWHLLTTSPRIQGTLIDTCTESRNNGNNSCSGVVISYWVHNQYYARSAWPFALNDHEPATVLYDPQDPGQETVASFTNLWFGPFICLLAGLFFSALTIGKRSINGLRSRKEAELAEMPWHND